MAEVAQIKRLMARIETLEASLPNTLLLHKKFWKRAFAVLGHSWEAMIIIYGGILLLAAVVVGFAS